MKETEEVKQIKAKCYKEIFDFIKKNQGGLNPLRCLDTQPDDWNRFENNRIVIYLKNKIIENV